MPTLSKCTFYYFLYYGPKGNALREMYDKPEVAEKFEYMEDVSRVTRVMSVASSTPQTKNYLAKKSGGIQKRATKSPSPPDVIKANPVPDYKGPYIPVIEHRLIELPMFSLPGEEISKRKSQEIEERIRQEKENGKDA
ncbi:hypothetical protein C1646_818412 [Rhizophagus diaphanus]|nr:hypothetical protein C1646_818412 [Rhizophagus diaphanus] [Rhizophagus sp. MUCL 43196]